MEVVIMKWMKHQKQARMGKPLMVTITSSGKILFNVKSVRQAIKDAKYFDTFFGIDEESKEINVIGFKFLSEITETGGELNFRRKTASGRYSQVTASIGHELAQKAGTKRGLSKRVPLEFDSTSGMWYFDTRKGEFVNTSTYVDGHAKRKK